MQEGRRDIEKVLHLAMLALGCSHELSEGGPWLPSSDTWSRSSWFLPVKTVPGDAIFASKDPWARWYVSSHCRNFNIRFHTSKLLLIVLFFSVYTTLFCLAKQTVVSSEAGVVSYFRYVSHCRSEWWINTIGWLHFQMGWELWYCFSFTRPHTLKEAKATGLF